jgi:hypothetical protein
MIIFFKDSLSKGVWKDVWQMAKDWMAG